MSTKMKSILVVLAFVLSTVDARLVPHGCSVSPFVPEGTKEVVIRYIREETNASVSSSDGTAECEQMYGFLPCSNNRWGHLFLILVYQYLLFHGESYVAAGSEQIFKLLGPGIFGASAFHVLSALPDSVILVASGLLNSKETAQEYVLTGVGLMAGSSIFLLTLLWGTCVVLGSVNFSSGMELRRHISLQPSDSIREWIGRLLKSLTGAGVMTDLETSYTARIMGFSVIPLAIIQFEKLFTTNSGQRAVILSALIVSTILLLVYFIYQVFEPWIQRRRLEYVKHEQLVMRILQHVQKRTLERLLADDGSPNTRAIRRLFEEIDQDRDDHISPSELKELLIEIKFKNVHLDQESAVDEVVKEFDVDGNQMISKEEFENGFTRWLGQAKIAIDKEACSTESFRNLYRIFEPFIRKKKEERDMKKRFVMEIVRQIQSKSTVERLLTEEGAPDLSSIRRLFEEMDRDRDNRISQAELKEIEANVKSSEVPLDVDEAAAKMIEMFDTSGDRAIDEEEFVAGLAKLLRTSRTDKEAQTPKSHETQDYFFQKTWEETDRLVEDDGKDGGVKLWWTWAKPLAQLLIGTAIMGVLAEPLIHSVQSFSSSVSIPSFFISFVLVPWATNARGAASAIKAVRRKKPRTTSLTFSEDHVSADLRRSFHEQHFGNVCPAVPYIRTGLDMEVLGGGSGGPNRLGHHQPDSRNTVHLPSMHSHPGLLVVPTVACRRLSSRASLRLLVKLIVWHDKF